MTPLPRITESAVEDLAIRRLEEQGFAYACGPDIAPDGASPLRSSFEEMFLLDKLKAAITRLNPSIPPAAREDALRQILRFHSPELISNNETFHRFLTEGIPVIYQQNNNPRGDLVWLVDFDHPLFNKMTLNDKQIQTLEELRDTLLLKLMSGEVRVRDWRKEKRN